MAEFSPLPAGAGTPPITPQHDRAACARIINAVLQGRSLEYALELSPPDRPLIASSWIREVCCGTLRHLRVLEHVLKHYLHRPLRPRYRLCRCLLLCALYQISTMRIPDHAAVHSSVTACEELRCPELKGLVNAILRAFIRDGGALPEDLPGAIRYSYPDFLYAMLCQAFSGDKLGQVLEEGNRRPPLFLRVENSKITTDRYLILLKEHAIDAKASALSPGAVLLEQPCAVHDLPGFDRGLVSVQDLSAQLAAPLLPLQGDECVLDCCSAPGGKGAHLLDLHPGLQLWCCDSSTTRLQLTRDTMLRLQRKVHYAECDARRLQQLGRHFDAVLLDAPCSGTGVIRRHPDIKWLRRPGDVERLTALQAQLLDSTFAVLKPGGFLLYTTCSILPAENITQVQRFMRQHAHEAELAAFELSGWHDGCCQRLTGCDGGDGFFYALLHKRLRPLPG